MFLMQNDLPVSLRAQEMEGMNILNDAAERYPNAISFCSGRPAEQFFDVESTLGNFSLFLHHPSNRLSSEKLGQYGSTKGIVAPFIKTQLFEEENIQVELDDVVVTSGCQEGMAICLMSLFRPQQDVLLIIDPTYLGIVGIARLLNISIEPVPCSQDTLDKIALETAVNRVRARGQVPRCLYIIPDFSNPLGTRLSCAARMWLLSFAKKENILILEDNPYRGFCYEGDTIPTLKALDSENQVIYLGTFSKTLMPGLRIGYLIANQEIKTDNGAKKLSDELSKVKSYITVNTSPLLQAIVNGTLIREGGHLKRGIALRNVFYKAKRDKMLRSLEQFFGPISAKQNIIWNRPEGGFFLTLSLPFVFNEAAFKFCAENYGVLVCPMQLFSLLPGREHQVRLAFSYVSDAAIEEGIRRLAQYVTDQIHLQNIDNQQICLPVDQEEKRNMILSRL